MITITVRDNLLVEATEVPDPIRLRFTSWKQFLEVVKITTKENWEEWETERWRVRN